jgi:aminoglycoside phosphotransferase
MPVGDSVHLLEEKTKMIDRDIQEPSWQEELPIELRPLLDRTNWRMVTIGCSGMHVFHVRDGYLKIADQRRGVKSTLFGEYERLCWLQGQLPVPQVYHYSKSASFEYLYLSEIVGVMACDQQFQADMPLFLRLLAEALHMVHDIESDQCPFPRLLQSRMEQMRQKIASRTLNLSAFSAAHQGATPQEWLTQLEQLQPTTEDLVFVHGDFCLPNILIDPQKRCVNGLIDWGLCGIADRYMDLDTASWSLGYNFDPSWIPGLFDAYGLKTVDQKKLIFYRALDRT